jgi:hypothetical protein
VAIAFVSKPPAPRQPASEAGRVAPSPEDRTLPTAYRPGDAGGNSRTLQPWQDAPWPLAPRAVLEQRQAVLRAEVLHLDGVLQRWHAVPPVPAAPPCVVTVVLRLAEYVVTEPALSVTAPLRWWLYGAGGLLALLLLWAVCARVVEAGY